jgi:hypothetical protein
MGVETQYFASPVCKSTSFEIAKIPLRDVTIIPSDTSQ